MTIEKLKAGQKILHEIQYREMYLSSAKQVQQNGNKEYVTIEVITSHVNIDAYINSLEDTISNLNKEFQEL